MAKKDKNTNIKQPSMRVVDKKAKKKKKKKNKIKNLENLPSIEDISTQSTSVLPTIKSESAVVGADAPIGSVSVTAPEDVAMEDRIKASKNIRQKKKQKKKFRKVLIILLIVFVSLLIAGAISAYVYFYSTDSFKVENVVVNGVEHLTNEEVDQLTDIPEDTTLLKVDTETIKKRLKRDAWIQDVNIVLEFPNTLVINVTERSITAIVEVPTSASSINTKQAKKDSVVRNWAISADHIWLMPVPAKDSEAAKNINPKIYNDVEGVMHIVDVSPSVSPEIGSVCTDDVVNCAIDVVSSMTTELKNQVKNVKATDSSSTSLILNNGVEISIGTAEDIRDKERVCLELLAKYEGKISYINVRSASSPTWRMI